METQQTVINTGANLCVYDDRGRLVGFIPHPVHREAIGPGREKVYLARAGQAVPCAAAA